MYDAEGYSLKGYGRMLAESERIKAYIEALHQVVKPESVVVDIGTGTGIFALMACRFGAKKVYAIESSDVIQMAKQIAADNGVDQQIEFVEGMSLEVTLPEKGDVVVSDLRGILPFHRRHLPSVIDARKRLLKPKGKLIPDRDTLWGGVVEAPDLYQKYEIPWAARELGLNMKTARQAVINNWNKGVVKPEQLLVKPYLCMTLDYMTITNHDLDVDMNWTIGRDAIAHGCVVWFDTELLDTIGFSNAPGRPELIYQSAFFPWEQPVDVKSGDGVAFNLKANLVGEAYIWRWETRVYSQKTPHDPRYHFQQSTFFEETMSLDRFKKTEANYVPELNDTGRLDKTILRLMAEKKPLGIIANRLYADFPDRFVNGKDALRYIGKLSQKYCL